jgi:small-conductance mechanosensitive channel
MRLASGSHVLILALLAGTSCGREGQTAPGNDVPALDTLIVSQPAAADTAAAAVPDTLRPITPVDSVRSDIALLTTRVESLIHSNDSLRADIAARAATRDSAATAATGQALLQEAGEQARHYGPRAFWAIVVIVLTFYVIRITVYVVERLAERNAQRRLFFKRLAPIVRIVLWTVTLVFVIRVVFAVDARGLLAAMTAVGVAIGFAAQDILKNIFGGLVIVFDQPFQVGDKIQVGGSYGEVVSIGLRSTRIVTPDDSLVSVPNAQIVDGQVSNANSGALDCQVVIDLYLPGWVDESKARRIAYQATASSKFVFLQKPIVVLVRDRWEGTFVTHLKVKAYVIDTRYEFAFMSEVTERARAEFRRQGLLAPWHGAQAWVNLPADMHPQANGEPYAPAWTRGDTV